jgi:hypothetical protein
VAGDRRCRCVRRRDPSTRGADGPPRSGRGRRRPLPLPRRSLREAQPHLGLRHRNDVRVDRRGRRRRRRRPHCPPARPRTFRTGPALQRRTARDGGVGAQCLDRLVPRRVSGLWPASPHHDRGRPVRLRTGQDRRPARRITAPRDRRRTLALDRAEPGLGGLGSAGQRLEFPPGPAASHRRESRVPTAVERSRPDDPARDPRPDRPPARTSERTGRADDRPGTSLGAGLVAVMASGAGQVGGARASRTVPTAASRPCARSTTLRGQ